MSKDAFIAGFVSNLALWISILLIAMAWSYAKRFVR